MLEKKIQNWKKLWSSKMPRLSCKKKAKLWINRIQTETIKEMNGSSPITNSELEYYCKVEKWSPYIIIPPVYTKLNSSSSIYNFTETSTRQQLCPTPSNYPTSLKKPRGSKKLWGWCVLLKKRDLCKCTGSNKFQLI